MIGGTPVIRAYTDKIEAKGVAKDCVSVVDEAARPVAL